MDKDRCLKTINIINKYLKKQLWMMFEICRMDQGQIVLSGRVDEMERELIEISFVQPFMASCLMGFIYEGGLFLSMLQGEEALEINKKFNVEQGNHIFRLFVDGMGDSCFIIAKEIYVNVIENGF